MANSAKGQEKLNTKVTIFVENLSLGDALSKLEKSSHVKFSYNSRITQPNQKVSIEANEEVLSDILARILKPLNITFAEVSNQIVLQKENAQGEDFKGFEVQQSIMENLLAIIIVKGKVIDERGNPLPGATIIVKGTNTAVVADSEGYFTIEAPNNDSKLIVSYVGMESREVTIRNKPLTIVLNEIGQKLDEVIITTGYEKTSKRTFTGAISKITGKELKIEGVVDLSRMIEGKAAGVTVQNVTGSFGSAPKITVRGSSSIFGDTKPLWVIDGIVQEDIINLSFADLASGDSATLLSSSIAGLNANDVLSIEVLKDASATSIYGSRAMNGVVVVTTKQGRRNSPLKITYALEQSLRTVPSYSQFDILNSQETMSVFKEMESKGFLELPSVSNGRYGGVYNILARAINTYNPATGTFLVHNDTASKNAFLQQYEMANTDWFKILFRPSITQNHSLSFSGGGTNSAFYASMGFYNDPGWTLADKVNQFSTNLKETLYVNDKFNVALSSIISLRTQKAPGTFESEKDQYYGKTTRNFDINPFNYALNTNRTLRPFDLDGNQEYYRNNWAPANILNEINNNYMDIDVKDIRIQADLEYKITPKIIYNGSITARYANTTREHNVLEKSNVVGAYNAAENTIVRDKNIFLYQDPNDLTAPKVSVLPNGGFLRKLTNDLVSYNVRNSFSYRNTINDIHEIEGFLGQEIRSVNRSSDEFTAYGIQYDRGLTSFTDPTIIKKVAEAGDSYFKFNNERERSVGFFGRGGYTYDRRYTVSLTGRYDGSNKQGSANSTSWLPTYTVSGKWNIAEESFMKNYSNISKLSVRAAYGLTATAGSATNAYAIYKSFITDRLNLTDREIGLNIYELQNTGLTWEKQFETNLGLDLGAFNNRIQFTTDIYKRKAFDLIDYVVTSGVGGQKIKIGNNADMETKGLEFALTTLNFTKSNFNWTTTLNFSIYDQKITRLQNKQALLSLVNGNGGNIVGQPRNALYSYQFTGLNIQGLPTFVMADGENDKVAGANFQDTEDITKYLKYEGSLEPNKTAGFSNTFSYKSWSLNIFIVASGGNKIRLTPAYSSTYNDLSVFTKDFTNRWINPGDENFTNIPVIADKRIIDTYLNNGSSLEIAYNAYNYSTVRVADGSFIRMKNISVGWEFPTDLKKKLKLTTFTLKGTTTNPFLIYSDKKLNGQDPEFYRTGGVSLPIASQYTLSINLTL